MPHDPISSSIQRELAAADPAIAALLAATASVLTGIAIHAIS